MTNERVAIASMTLFYAGIALWLGALAFFGFGVAPVVFKNLPSKDLAGGLNAIVIGRLNSMEFVAAALLLLGAILGALGDGGKQGWIVAGIAGVMVAALCAYALGIFPAMSALRAQIRSFDAPQAADEPLIAQFRAYRKGA